jgi:hypothetical protein
MFSLWTSCDGGELGFETLRTIYWPRKRHVLQFLWQSCRFTMATTSSLLLLPPSGTRFGTFWCFGALHGRRTEQAKRGLSETRYNYICSSDGNTFSMSSCSVHVLQSPSRDLNTDCSSIALFIWTIATYQSLWVYGLLTSFCVCRQSQKFSFLYFPFPFLLLYRPSSGEIITVFLEAVTPTTDPFLGYTVLY